MFASVSNYPAKSRTNSDLKFRASKIKSFRLQLVDHEILSLNVPLRLITLDYS